jgi:hypothetical protein
MKRSGRTGSRATALLALSALILVVLGSAVGLASDPEAAGERCVGCAECERGNCGREEGNPLLSHHHCCASCCMSHAPLALSAALSSPAPVIAETMLACAPPAELGRNPETPYRPPRI